MNLREATEELGTPDVEALVTNNLKLAYWLAARYGKAYGLDPEEAEQEAVSGLVKAANAFNPAIGKNFAAFASAYIRNDLRHQARPVRPGVQRLHRVDLDAPVMGGDEGGEGGDETSHELVRGAGHERGVGVEREEAMAALRAELERISSTRDRGMVERWLNGETYREIAQDVGVSFVYVGKIVTRELERLRQRLREKGITPDVLTTESLASRLLRQLLEGEPMTPDSLARDAELARLRKKGKEMVNATREKKLPRRGSSSAWSAPASSPRR